MLANCRDANSRTDEGGSNESSIQFRDDEGFDYKPNIQIPLFSESTGPSEKCSSLSSLSDDDAMAIIVSNPDLWREFQGRLKKTGSITGARANTKEVLREFVKEKGLNQAKPQDDNVSRPNATGPMSLLQAFSNGGLASSNEGLAERFKERQGLGSGQASTTAGILRAARRRSRQLSLPPSTNKEDLTATDSSWSSFLSLGNGSRSSRCNLSNSSILENDTYEVEEEEAEEKRKHGGTLALPTSLLAALNLRQETEETPAFRPAA